MASKYSSYKTGVALTLVASMCSFPTYAAGDFAGAEVPSSGQAPRFVVDSRSPTWANNVLNYYYNPTDQPESITTLQVLELIQNAGRKWSNVCNVTFNYLGITTSRPNVDGTFDSIDRNAVIGWASLSGNKAGFAAYATYWYENPANMVDADMVINTTGPAPFTSATLGNLGALVTHELGHMLGISHSDRQQSVMFANPYNSYAFQSTLRGDDAAACASLYGAAPNSIANRVFNWAEQTVPQLLAPSGVASKDQAGIHFRYYAGTNSYLGLYNGQLVYVDPTSKVLPLGTPESFLGSAESAGF